MMHTLTKPSVDVTRFGNIVRIKSAPIDALVRTVVDDLTDSYRRADLDEYADAKAEAEESSERDACMDGPPQVSDETEYLAGEADKAFERLELSDCLALPVADAMALYEALGAVLLAPAEQPVLVPAARSAA